MPVRRTSYPSDCFQSFGVPGGAVYYLGKQWPGARDLGRTGLGLALVHHLEAQGGTVLQCDLEAGPTSGK